MILEKKIEQLYRRRLFVRNDNKSGVHYFTPEDFPGLRAHPYSFKARAGHELKGHFYHYDAPIPGRVLVFDHGMGNGHRAYMREIRELAKGGFLVFSYDHTGCMASGGESTNGFSQSLSDLDDCMKALKAEPALADYRFSVIGHSWGGYSTMNITALHPEITHVVSMSGFISVEQIIRQSFTGPLALFRKSILRLESRTNPDYVNFNAVKTLSETRAKVLLIYSDNDSMIRKDLHYDVLHRALAGRENIHFLLVSGKDHNPTFQREAVLYKNEFFRELKRLEKSHALQTDAQRKAFMESHDWNRMTEQDDAVWAVILEMLRGKESKR